MSASPEPFKSFQGPLTPRGHIRLSLAQRWLSAGLWTLAALLAATLNPPPTEQAYPALLYLLLIHVIAIVLSIRLPGGVYTGLINASVIVAVLLVGYRQALVVAPLTAVVTIPAALITMTALPRLRQYRDRLIFEIMWHSAITTLSLVPAGLLYERLGGGPSQVLTEPAGYLAYVVLIVVHFAFTFTFSSVWLRLTGGVRFRPYWARYALAYAINGLLITVVFSPEFASRYTEPTFSRYGGLLFYTLIAVIVFAITRTQLSLMARVADLRTLNSIGQALNANLDLNDLAEAIHAEIDRRLDASSFYLALLEDEGRMLNFVLAYEESERLGWGLIDARSSLSEHVVRTRRPLLLHRPYRKGDLGLDLQPVRSPGKSFVAVPIIADDEVIGVLGLRNFQQEYAYHQDDVRLLEIVASSAAVALQNARLYEQSRRQAHELTSLHTVSALVSASLDLDAVIESICRVVVDVMEAQKSAVFLADEEGQIYRLAGSKGLSRRYQEMTTGLSIAADPRAVVMRSGQIAIIEDLLGEPRFEAHADLFREEEVRSVLEAPLRVGEQVIGTLAVYYETSRQFHTGQVELLQTLAGQVAVAVENARLFAATNARRRQLEILHETSRTVNATLALDPVLKTVARSMIEGLNADTAAVLLIDARERQLNGKLWMELSDGVIAEQPPESVQLAVSQLNRVREHLHDPDVIGLRSDHDGNPGPLADLSSYFGLETGLALPLVLHDELFGLIVIGRRQTSVPFQPETMRLARALADQATVAIQNARLFELTDVALSRRVEEMAALETISQRMARRLDLQTVIEQVVSAAILATGAEIGEVLLLDESSGLLETAVRQGQSRAQPLSTWPADWGVVGRALRVGEAVLVDDTSRDPDYVATVSTVRSELAVPIILDERRLGVLNLESFELAAFDEEQARFVSNLAEHAAIAIQNAQLFEAVQQRAEEFQTLRAIAVDLLSSTNLSHSLRVIAHQALARSQAKDVHIYLYDQAREELTFGTSLWANGQIDVEFAKPRRNGITYTVARTGEAQIISDPTNHPLFGDVMGDPAWAPLETMLSMPLKRGDEVLGIFNIAFEQRGVVSEDLLHFLDLLASQAAVAIATARLTEATRTGHGRLQAILNSIHDGILMFDMAGRLVLVNPRVEDLFDLKLATCVGQRFPALLRHLRTHFQGEDAVLTAEALNLVRQFQNDPQAVTHRRYRFHTPAARQIDESSIPVINNEGDMIGRLFILRDTTREAEMESYRQEMSNMLVHDLRSPLAGVITGLHLALEEAKNVDTDPTRDLIETSVRAALTSANTLLRLIEQILEISRLEAGEMSLACEEVRLGDIAAQALDMLAGTAAEADIVVTIEEVPDLPPAHADPDKLRRVFLNLLDNALRYTPSDGEVNVRLTSHDADLMVIIEDSGSGIPPELHERIFERFFQGDPARRKRGVKGSGLGLTFCRLAVEAHGGRIWAEERPGGGSRFTFTLPAETHLAAQPAEAD